MGQLSYLQNKVFDLIVIGGGIVGSGIARDAALRGLSTLLFEKNDYCSGTTSRSTRLIHGGLRYLETCDFRLVRLDLVEREVLLSIAGHLVKPLPFLVPFYGRSAAYRCKVGLGMMLYDLLGYDKTLPSHQRLRADEIAASEPLLDRRGLQGGFLYYDAQAPAPERLVIENLIDAREHGAKTYNYSEVTGAIRNGKGIEGVRVKDLTDGGEFEVKGKVVVNAAGPWFDQVSRRIGNDAHPRVRMTKGIHLVCRPLSKHALVLFSGIDRRLFFVVPWLGQSLLGTTDTDYLEDPGKVRCDTVDAAYLLDSIRPFIPSIEQTPIRYGYAGVRALVPEEGGPSSVSRMHMISDESRNGTEGLISVIGGKITGYRSIAQDAVDLVCSMVGLRLDCRTAEIPLPGFREPLVSSSKFLDEATVRHLNSLYGSRAAGVMDLAGKDVRLRKPLAVGYPDIAAEVVHSIRIEQCMHATDFLLRRSVAGYFPDRGCNALPSVVTVMGEELSWSAEKKQEEFEMHMRWVRDSQNALADLPAQPCGRS